MKGSQVRRSMPIFSIGTVKKLTDLTARQIRYYEEHGLIEPQSTESDQRLFSFNEIEILLKIKDMMDQGIDMEEMKPIFSKQEEQSIKYDTQKQTLKRKKEISNKEIRRHLRKDILNAARFNDRGTDLWKTRKNF